MSCSSRPGVSGLTAAWELAKKGYPVVLFERGSKLGGRLLELEEKVLPNKVIEDELSVRLNVIIPESGEL